MAFKAPTVLWPPHAKSWLIGKDSDAGRDWGQEEKGTTEDEMAGWHHGLDGLSLSELREMLMDREAWRAATHGVAKSWTRLSDWTELNWTDVTCNCFYLFTQSWHIRVVMTNYYRLNRCVINSMFWPLLCILFVYSYTIYKAVHSTFLKACIRGQETDTWL